MQLVLGICRHRCRFMYMYIVCSCTCTSVLFMHYRTFLVCFGSISGQFLLLMARPNEPVCCWSVPKRYDQVCASVSSGACHWGNPTLQSDGPQKNEEKADLALSFYKTAGLTRHSILKAIPGPKIATYTVASATSISSLVTKIRQNFSHRNSNYISLC